jgi:hypothetical protein
MNDSTLSLQNNSASISGSDSEDTDSDMANIYDDAPREQLIQVRNPIFNNLVSCWMTLMILC